MLESFEKVPVKIFKNPTEGSNALAAQIATLHNLHFYLWLVKEARKHIIEGDFASWKDVMVKKLGQRL